MADMLERIAKEVGHVHTNEREISTPPGQPFQLHDVNAMTPEQINDELRVHLQDPATRAFIAGLMGTEAAPSPALQRRKEMQDGKGEN